MSETITKEHDKSDIVNDRNDFRKSWDEIVKKYPEVNFLQSPKYGRMHEMLGCKVIVEDFAGKGYAQMIVRNAKRGRYLEIPCGPLIDWNEQTAAKAVFARIAEVAKQEKCVFVRVRPQLADTPENIRLLEGLGLKRAPMHLAAEHTVIIDLQKSESDLLANMRRQTRYEVRRADKLGISVDKSNDEAIFQEFRKCQAETARRQNFVPPSLKTLLAEREAFGDDIVIYRAFTGEVAEKMTGSAEKTVEQAPDEVPTKEPIAYGLIIKSGLEADYYEAASTLLNRKLPGAYALLWQVMKDLKLEGYKRFNLWGIAPAGQPNHRYAGVTTFKTGFGGEVVAFVPAHDLVISKMRYTADFAFETLRKKRRHL